MLMCPGEYGGGPAWCKDVKTMMSVLARLT